MWKKDTPKLISYCLLFCCVVRSYTASVEEGMAKREATTAIYISCHGTGTLLPHLTVSQQAVSEHCEATTVVYISCHGHAHGTVTSVVALVEQGDIKENRNCRINN